MEDDETSTEDDDEIPITLTHDEYTVGWICASHYEQTAATAMLDEQHGELEQSGRDENTYTLGAIGKHNIVIACLANGDIGTNSAANMVTQMVNTFPSIKFGLMVGTGGGIPPKVSLGDVVVSSPVDQKSTEDNHFRRTGALGRPPKALLTALTKLDTSHEMKGSKIRKYLNQVEKKWKRLVPSYTRCPPDEDSEDSQGRGALVRFGTQPTERQKQKRETKIRYGLIASGNSVIKDAAKRDQINEDLGGQVLCIEIEAAGLMNNFPCLVIRGISDYADSRKNDIWQKYASAVAAAFAKELLGFTNLSDVKHATPVREILEHIQSNTSKTLKDVSHIKSRIDKSEIRTVLNWITPLDYGPKQSDTLRRRQPGTGQWLLDSNQFQNWKAASKQTLFCPGIPGAGKTILTSIVIEHLDIKFQNDQTVGIAYLYCNFQMHDEQKDDDLLLSILKQLAESQPSGTLPTSTQALYSRHIKRNTRPSKMDIRKEIEAVVEAFSRVFVVVDALDECPLQVCKKFIPELFWLQKKLGINIFATSRFIPEIVDQFKQRSELLEIFEIRATKSDVENFLKGHIDGLSAPIRQDEKMQEEIITGIAPIVNGMFLLAQIYFNLLRDKMTKNAVRSMLKKFQTKGHSQGDDENGPALSSAYEQTMERISKQEQGFKDLAMGVLQWITHAKRPLNTSELRHALATKEGEPNHCDDNLSDPGEIVAVCAGLVTVDEQSGVIRLVHYTTQEYLEQSQMVWFPGAETHILNTCIAYLSYDVFGTGSCDANDEFKTRQRSYPLYTYAASNWGHHMIKHAKPSPELMAFLENQGKVEASSQSLMPPKKHAPRAYLSYAPKKVTGLHLAGYFGITEVVKALLQREYDANVQDNCGRTPLWWASRNGHRDTVKLLVDSGCIVDKMDREYGFTPLCWAARNGNETIAQLLLDYGANANSADKSDRTPLSWAANSENKGVIHLLLSKGAKIDENDSAGKAKLAAAISGTRDVLQMPSGNRTDPTATFDTSLQAPPKQEIATQSQRQANYPLRWPSMKGKKPLQKQNALMLASMNNNVAIAKLLFGAGAEFVTEGAASASTLLAYAIIHEHEAIIELLLENGASPSVGISSDGTTALELAAVLGSEAVVHHLVEAGADINARATQGTTCISLAAVMGRESVVRFLLERGADITIKNDFGQVPLYYAAKAGNKAIVKMLLGTGKADVNAMDIHGQTALAVAAYSGDEGTDKYGRTPSEMAHQKGHARIKQLLFDTRILREMEDRELDLD
ncbi:ankyrin repeat-containing domain protein [Trichoderma compactum]